MRRRELLLAAAGLLAAPATARAAGTEGDVLLDLMTREQRAKLAYGKVLRALGETAPPELAAIRLHESDHADALTTELAAVGLPRPHAPHLSGTAAKLAAATDRAAVLDAAAALEDELVAAYTAALAGLPDKKIAMTAATILASHSQHRVILRLAAGASGS
jgi:glycerol-3-phosphate dehydrogenase